MQLSLICRLTYIAVNIIFYSLDLQKLLTKLMKLIEEQQFKNIYERLEALREEANEQKASLQNSAKEYCGPRRTSSRYSTCEFTYVTKI